jgi:hypothetical protein
MATVDNTTDDPVLKLIEAHQWAGHLFETFADPRGDVVLERQLNELCNELGELTADLANTAPTSLRGCAAVLRYVAENPDADRWPDPEVDDWRRKLLVGVAAAIERLAA